MVTGKAPRPKMPKVKRITKMEELVPAARRMISKDAPHLYEGMEIKKGQKVLIINDTTADQLVVEALSAAILEKGAHLNVITLEGNRGMKDPGELMDSQFSNNWYPQWVWDAAKEADLVVPHAFLKAAHTPLPNLPNKPKINNCWELTADLMLSEHQTYPVQIRDAIDEIAWSQLFNCTTAHWTDLEGTDIEMKLTPEDWKRVTAKKLAHTRTPYHPGHLMLPAPVIDMNGVFVTSSVTFGGPIPRTKFYIENGKVVKVVGGGKYGDRLRKSFIEHKDLHTKASCPGPGINWITTIGICTNPHVRQSPFFKELEGSARIVAWTFGHRRAGVMHTSVGEGLVSPTHKIIRHMDTFFNTLVTDKGTVIENGHLTTLDDPKIRKIAKKYGDPDVLLKEIWVPAVSGVNAP